LEPLLWCAIMCLLGWWCSACLTCFVGLWLLVLPRSSGGSHAGGGGESRRCVQPDTEVACKVRDVEGSGGWIWILGTVLRYAADTKKYEVLDAGEVEDDDNDAEKRRNGHPPQPKYVLDPRLDELLSVSLSLF